MKTRLARVGLILFASLLMVLGLATAQTNVRFTLDWAIQGPQALFLVAQDQGYFEEEGLNVSIDRGFGSAGAVSQIAGGAYDIGFADINSMVEFNVENPDEALIAIAVVYNYPPFSIVTTADRDIEEPQDLVGKRIGAPAFDASFRLWPVFSRAIGIDEDSVEWVSMDPALREPSLIRGEVDAIGAFYFTAALNLEAAGIPLDDVVHFLYAEHGIEAYGNAVMASPEWLEANEDAVRGMMRALTRAWHDVLRDPEGAIDAVVRADELVEREVELARLNLAIESNMLTPEVYDIGFGAVDPDRLARSIEQIVEAFELERTPSLGEVFTDAYLPPLEERLPPAE